MGELKPTVFEPLQLDVELHIGATLAEIVRLTEIPIVLHDRVVLILNGSVIDPATWSGIYVLDGDRLTIAVVPSGGGGNGKQVFAAVAVLAITVASGGLAAGLVGLAPGLTAGLSATTVAAITQGVAVGISMIGALAVSALVPPPSVSTSPLGRSSVTSSPDESPTYAAGGQSNNVRPYSTVKRVFGRFRVAADLAAVPLIDNVGKTGTVSSLYYFSAGSCKISDLRFGDQPLATFDPAFRVLKNSYGTNLKYLHDAVGYDEFAFTIDETDWLELQTKIDTVKATVDFTFPGGLVRMSGNERLQATVPVQVRWRAKNSGDDWKYLGASSFAGAKLSNSGGSTWSNVYEPNIEDGGVDSDDCTAWVVEYYEGKNSSDVTLMIYRDGVRIYQRGGYTSSTLPTSVTTGGVTYAAGAFPGDSTEEKYRVYQYAELLIASPVSGNSVAITNNTREPFTVGATMSFPEAGLYEIQVRRTAVPSTSDVIADDMVVTLLRSYAGGDVLALKHRATMVELQVVATDQISGSIPTVNAIVSSELRAFNASGFTGSVVESANPAEIAVDLLTGGPQGVLTKFPLKASQIEFADFDRLRKICDEIRTQSVNGVDWTGPRFEWNGVLENDITLGDAVNSVLSAARAQLRFTSTGKIGVLIDEVQTQPRALITPANSWDFHGARPFAQQPHAIRINFNDEEQDWQAATVAVFNTGYSIDNATVFEDLDAWGITNFAEAWRYGRYMLKQAILRSETFTVSQDAEYLVVQRGELVTIQHDVPLQGGLAARVVEVSGEDITLDRLFSGGPSGYVVRSSSGSLTSGAITEVLGTDAVRVQTGHAIEVGNLITIGELDTVTRDYLVKQVEPGEDFSARLTLVKYDPAVFDDEDGPLPPWDPGFGENLIDGTNIAATNLTAAQTWTYADRRPIKSVSLAWKITGAAATYYSAIIEWKVGTAAWQGVGSVDGGARSYIHKIPFDERALWAEKVTYRVRPFNGLGYEGKADTVSIQLTDYAEKPKPPRNAFLDVRGQEILVSWDASLSPDVAQYLIRYTPRTDDGVTWFIGTQVAALSWDQDQATFKARTGTYMIRALNAVGIMSDVVYLRTTIETLPDLNVVAVIDDAAEAWPGDRYRFETGNGISIGYADVLTLENELVEITLPSGFSYYVRLLDGSEMLVGTSVEFEGDYLISDDTWIADTTQDQAVYNIDPILDLGAIYETSLQAKHQAFALRQKDAPAFAKAHANALKAGKTATRAVDEGLQLMSDEIYVPWECWAEYRSSSAQDPIKVWGPIKDHGPIATAGINYGPWRKFLATHATARYFEFRLVAETDADGVRIIVIGGRIELDMPDRTWRRQNVAIQAGGTVVNFDPQFAAKPIIAVTIEGNTTATSYKALSINRSAVEVALYNNSGTSVAGQIDLAALGYGKEKDSAL